jgi:hypothetical protein
MLYRHHVITCMLSPPPCAPPHPPSWPRAASDDAIIASHLASAHPISHRASPPLTTRRGLQGELREDNPGAEWHTDGTDQPEARPGRSPDQR